MVDALYVGCSGIWSLGFESLGSPVFDMLEFGLEGLGL